MFTDAIFFFITIVVTQTVWCSCFSLEIPSGQIWGWWCLRCYKKTQWAWKAVVLCLPILLSLLLFFSFPLTLLLIYARHECLGVCVCGLNLYERLLDGGDNRGRVIDMCRRTQDKQPPLHGVTPACLIHFDWAKTERWDEKAMELEETKSRDEMTQRKLLSPASSNKNKDSCKC